MGNPLAKKTWDNTAIYDVLDRRALEKVIRQASMGNRASLKSLCESIARSVTFRVTRKLHSQSDVEDVTQEILIRVCESIHSLKDPKAFAGWLNTIINNEINRYLKKNWKHGVVLSMDEYLDSFELEEDVDASLSFEYIFNDADRKEIIAVVDALPDRQLEAVLLHYYEGMSITETAKTMGITKQVVTIHLARAQKKIKDTLIVKQAKTEIAYGYSAMPVGILVAQALHEEAALLPLLSDGLVDKAIASSLAKGLAAGKASSFLSYGKVVASLATAAVAASLVFFALSVSTENPDLVDIPVAVAFPIDTEGEIVFSGGLVDKETVNPLSAEVWAENERGRLNAIKWWITPHDSDTVLSCGTGARVDESLASMCGDCQSGTYILWFSLEDNEGSTYTLQRDFSIELCEEEVLIE